MGKTSGYVLILAGLAVGGYALYPDLRADAGSAGSAMQGAQPSGNDGIAAAALKAVLKISGAPTLISDKPLPSNKAAPEPQPAPRSAPEPSKGDGKSPGEPTGPPAPAVTPPSAVPPAPVPAKRPRTAVAVKINEAPPRVPVGEATAAPPLEGGQLARAIQMQLKRVGCYRGEVTDAWTPTVREAMREFTERANASLPVNRPDPVLLAMLQTHAPGACSESCPSGQERAAGGQCVPSLLAAVTGGADSANRAGAAVRTKTAKGVADVSAKAAKSAKAGRDGLRTAGGDAGVKGGKRSGADRAAGGLPPEQPAASSDGRMALAGPPDAGAAPAKRPQAGSPRRHTKAANASRSARTYRAYRPSPYKGYSGVPGWALPFFMQ